MKVKGSLYWIYSFISGCKGKMLVAILLAVIGVLCGMAPYFALAGILSGLIQNTLTAERIFCYVGIAVLGETLKMLFNTVSSLKAHRVAYHILGNAGGKLSGGERQRITIARAILKPADVVILDEASAYADPENEVYIEEAINELVKDKTLIVVAHRLETIENSDKIVVVDQGKIVAEGTQSELLKNCALYKRLWNETILTSERKRGECNA